MTPSLTSGRGRLRIAVWLVAPALALLAGCADGGGAPVAGDPSVGEPAVWEVSDPGEVRESSQTFEIGVTRVECASGVTGEVLPLEIEEEDEQVVITATVAQNGDGAANCQGNDVVVVTAQLEQPLGDRELVDGACDRFPDVATTTFCTDEVRWPP